MNFLEKDLETIIWESDNKELQQKNLPINGKKYRQLRIGNYGILDLMTIERKFYPCLSGEQKIKSYFSITVYELKKEKAGISAFLQATRYCRGIKTYIEKRFCCLDYQLNIVLCAKEIDTKSDFIYLTDMMFPNDNFPNYMINSLKLYSFEYKLDGINFINHECYDLLKTGF